MADGTHIEWTDAALNVVNGCTVVSPGCEHCYAMRLAATRLRHHPSRVGLARMHNGHPQWTGVVGFNEKVLLDPLHWRRPRKIFWNAHGDLFHEAVPDEWIDRCIAVMALTPHHIHQVLTKRPERMRAYFRGRWHVRIIEYLRAYDPEIQQNPRRGVLLQTTDGVLPNVWLGVSVEDQKRADERIPILLETPAAVRWLSCEPLLGPLDLSAFFAPRWPSCNCSIGPLDSEVAHDRNLVARCPRCNVALGGDPKTPLDWVVAGGESGPGARPMHPEWARSLRDQCAAAGVPFLFKQWGEWGLDSRGRFSANLVGSWKFGAGKGLSCLPDGSFRQEKISNVEFMGRCGKKAAGRELDGRLHDGFPA